MDDREWTFWELEQLIEETLQEWQKDAALPDGDELIERKRQEWSDMVYKLREVTKRG